MTNIGSQMRREDAQGATTNYISCILRALRAFAVDKHRL
jgi:hypothetical protein